MILAIKRLKNLGWIALVFIVLVSLYPLSLSVGAMRSNLDRTESKIVSVKKELRYLETEFATRASMQQLEQWNKLEYGYSPPTAEQYLDGERALANLGGDRKNMKKPVRVASLTLPGTAQSIAPAGVIGSPYGDSDMTGIPSSNEEKASKDEQDKNSEKADSAKPVDPKKAAARKREEFAAQMDVDLLTQSAKPEKDDGE